MKHSVYVGLSGGVDSAVSAALLKEQGYDVTGVFIKIWQPEFIECTWREDRLDAMRVCAALNIPLRELDLSEKYKKEVVEKMVADYARGVTPNPDVLCNRSIKFGAFAAWAKAEGARSVATGHYARNTSKVSHFTLSRAADLSKDQSYFLYTLTQSDLRHVLFPVGGLTKAEVRKEAERLGLPVYDKPDSQGLCFVGDVSMPEFLSRFIPLTPGRVMDKGGKAIGEHQGAVLYTLGQRHGFTTEKGTGGPYYVTGIDVQGNIVRVSTDRSDAARGEALLEHVSWTYREPQEKKEYLVQARYREEPVAARLAKKENGWVVTFGTPHIASAGQSLVVYDGDICVGGGVIASGRAVHT
jgi:tRNA-specific 2-thiouridylase